MNFFEHLKTEYQLLAGTADLAELFSEIEVQRVDVRATQDPHYFAAQWWLFGREAENGSRHKFYTVQESRGHEDRARDRALEKAQNLSEIFQLPWSDCTHHGDFAFPAPTLDPPPPSLHVNGRTVFYSRNDQRRFGLKVNHSVIYTALMWADEPPDWDYGRDIAHVRQITLCFPAFGGGLRTYADFASEDFRIPGRLPLDERIWLRNWLHVEAHQVLGRN